ncbi:hypothetical protein DYB35_012357 [Aphanomyces astaci]|uniref:Uncharacterized protein n=1 Tax=Aphanomyces astaci TaxID=112090 RepID=A0A418DUM8_APHAT|nr:hypothetical protein DYB35_012357 [Aphanomyces astaci]
MHKTVVAIAGVKCAKVRTQRNGNGLVKFPRFALRDFVLVARALQHPASILALKGPCRVVKVDSDHRLEVQQLVPPGETSLHHTSRLRFYCEGGRDIDEDLKAHIAFGDEGF